MTEVILPLGYSIIGKESEFIPAGDLDMRREQLIDALKVIPFRPFRLYVSDGGTLDVRHPEMLMVKHRSAVVGMLENSTNGSQEENYPRIERSTEVDLAHVTRIEELPHVR